MSAAGARPGRPAKREFSSFLMFLRSLVDKLGLKNLTGTEKFDKNPYSQKEEADSDVCIFCVRHDAELNRIMCENDSFFARYDNFPAAPGHVEIVPKKHIESFFDLSDQEVVEAYSLILEARKEIVGKYRYPDGYTIGVNEGRAAGRSVDHLHIHLIPRYAGDVEDARGGIRKATPNYDPDSWK